MHKFSFWDYDMAGRSRSRLAFLIVSMLFLILGCNIDSPPIDSSQSVPSQPSFRGFYHWQTNCHLSVREQQWLDSLQIDRLYLKFFDLDWDPSAASVVPLASIQLDTVGLTERTVVPTIFITNRSMLNIAEADIPVLAQRILDKIDRHFSVLDQTLTEVQLDCDWTGNSKTNYFMLLEHLQAACAEKEVAVSTTIRLHQLKYPDQTGVPPVEKGVLMFYNMGDLEDKEEPNSILNLEKAAAYLPSGLQYPLHLDLALPLFRWAILFRDGQMIKLINEPDAFLLGQSEKFVQLSSHYFEVVQSTYLQGYYLYKGDQLRVEEVSVSQLEAALHLVKRQYPAAAQNVIWYHLDEKVINRYSCAQLDTLMYQ